MKKGKYQSCECGEAKYLQRQTYVWIYFPKIVVLIFVQKVCYLKIEYVV